MMRPVAAMGFSQTRQSSQLVCNARVSRDNTRVRRWLDMGLGGTARALPMALVGIGGSLKNRLSRVRLSLCGFSSRRG
jgi:hypothetical protein